MPPIGNALTRLFRLPATLSLLDQACVSLGNAATGVIAARALGPDEFGSFVIANAALWLAVTLQGGLFLRPLALLGAPLDDAAFGRLLRANLIAQVVFIGVSSAAIGGLVSLWDPLAAVAAPAAAAAAAMQCQELCRRALFARGRVGAALANDCVSYDLQAGFCLALAVTGNLTLGSALLLIAASSLLAAGVGVWQLRGFAGSLRAADWTGLGEQLRIGRWTAATAVLGNMSQAGYPVLIGRIHGPAAAAGLGVAGFLLAPINLATRPFESYLLPRAARAFAHGGEAAFGRLMRRAASVLAPVYVGYLLVIAAVPEPLISLVYGERYLEHSSGVRLLALAQLLALPLPLLSLEAAVRRLQRWAVVADLWAVAMLLLAGIPLVGRLGLSGVAASAALALFGKVILLVVVTRRARQSSLAFVPFAER